MDVLSVTSEIFPLVKTGGLADVAGALPLALAAHDISVRTLVPGYPAVTNALKRGRVVAEIGDLFGGSAKLVAARVGGLDLIVLDAEHLFDRPGGIYVDDFGKDWTDNWQRFAALSWVAAELAKGMVEGYRPRIIHAHDWQAAMVAAYVAFGGDQQTRVVVTIHNIAFQGQFGADIFPHLRLPDAAFTMHGVEYYGGVGFLKGGLQCAHAITTVSPTYAREIRTPEYGMGLEGLLNQRGYDLHGILNGIDPVAWNPQTDPALAANYAAANTKKRSVNKLALTSRFNLDHSEGPLFGLVSRLTWQKGIDLIAANIDWLVSLGGQLAVLGSGEAHLEAAMADAAVRHPGRVGFVQGYDEDLSHLMQGGSDIMLVPSRFEPCGLTQLYGLRYGAVPLVSRVGGLADTVIDANEAAIEAGVATGIQFSPVDSQTLGEAILRAINLYAEPETWSRMQRKGMKTDVSWNNSAGKYAMLYQNLAADQ
ncbi:glycogen synthase GlgA [Pelagibacterium lentulum]|uniref:Glycogen synthase n=1 Tax=Pelagibacterium lentulum TaxID=2029865 RepID=A0A916RAB2_9HYPH|nr:glycogen synthase GlgA [Pelagibacterium lentulum]GGA46470.1 glycogen synthase [Pelagibacterium lentulum]